MKISKVLALLALVMCFASCGTLDKSRPYEVAATRMELNMDDFVFLGEKEISCEYDTYLGFIHRLNTVNGEMFNPGEKVSLQIQCNDPSILKCKGLKYAAAKLLKEYPDAHYFQVVRSEKNTDVLFLGSATKATARVRVYKFIDKKPKPTCCAAEVAREIAKKLK